MAAARDLAGRDLREIARLAAVAELREETALQLQAQAVAVILNGFRSFAGGQGGAKGRPPEPLTYLDILPAELGGRAGARGGLAPDEALAADRELKASVAADAARAAGAARAARRPKMETGGGDGDA